MICEIDVQAADRFHVELFSIRSDEIDMSKHNHTVCTCFFNLENPCMRGRCLPCLKFDGRRRRLCALRGHGDSIKD